ncbi:MAG TPA: phosphatidate cytidylyltransferase [Miltoncostaeaceae bacterium]|nr:phosphatidate cytidylyltransferase [Miltoncostaeaceae bacterium]
MARLRRGGAAGRPRRLCEPAAALRRAGGILKSRILVAVPGVIAAIVAVVLGGPLFVAVMLALAGLALTELYSLTAASRPLRWAGYTGAGLVIVLAWLHDNPEHGLLIGLTMSLILIAVAALMLPRRDDVTTRIAVTALGVVYIGMPLATLAITRELPHGAQAVTNVLVGVWVFDTASFIGGRLWGRRPIAPITSPRKTVEGALVGLVSATLGVWVAGLYMDWINGWQSLLLGLAICPAAFIGDLFESLLKRDVGAKDSGRILLGHGGVLDRFDAMLFAAPVAYVLTVALVY